MDRARDTREFAAYQWIAVRHEIDYRKPAFAGDLLSINTRIVRIRRVRAWYETIVRRQSTTLVEACSCWVCVDGVTGALNVMPAETKARFLPG